MSEHLAQPVRGDRSAYEGTTPRQITGDVRMFVRDDMTLGAYYMVGLERFDGRPGAPPPNGELGLTTSLWTRVGRTSAGATARLGWLRIETDAGRRIFFIVGVSAAMDYRLHERVRLTTSLGLQAIPRFTAVDWLLWLGSSNNFWNQFSASLGAGVGIDLWLFEVHPQIGLQYAKDSGLNLQAAAAVNLSFGAMK